MATFFDSGNRPPGVDRPANRTPYDPIHGHGDGFFPPNAGLPPRDGQSPGYHPVDENPGSRSAAELHGSYAGRTLVSHNAETHDDWERSHTSKHHLPSPTGFRTNAEPFASPGHPPGPLPSPKHSYSHGNMSSPPPLGGSGVSLPPLNSFIQGAKAAGDMPPVPNSSKAAAGMFEPTGTGSVTRLQYLAEEISKGVGTLSGGSSKQAEDLAKLRLVTTTHELLGTVRPPQDAIMGWFAYMGIVSAVHVFQDWKVFDAIPPAGMISYPELAEKVKAEETILLRMSWMLTSTGILRHHPSGHVSHTPVSILLRESEPMGSMFKLMYKNVVEVSTVLPSYFDTYGRQEPTGPNHLPSSFLEGQPELQYSQILAQDPSRRQVFMHAMALNHRRVPTTGMYDLGWVVEAAHRDPSRPVWVDIGGGNGFTVKVFREAFPDLPAAQCVVQDLPEVIEEARANPDPELQDVHFVAFDFHKDAPIHGALIYYLRHVLRESGDLVCVNILKNIATAMVEDSKVLISEQITQNPPPVFAAFKDYTMLSLGGKERTLENFSQVAEAAGLKITGVFPDKGMPHAVIELSLATPR